eukprot:365812-Chlamydomonas_euryale.AAC.8
MHTTANADPTHQRAGATPSCPHATAFLIPQRLFPPPPRPLRGGGGAAVPQAAGSCAARPACQTRAAWVPVAAPERSAAQAWCPEPVRGGAGGEKAGATRVRMPLGGCMLLPEPGVGWADSGGGGDGG